MSPIRPRAGRAGEARVLLIEHERVTPAGLVGDWLEARDADIDLVAIDERDEHEPPEAYDLIVSLGSEFSAYDDRLPWIAGELELLRGALAAGVPVLGSCFGAQLLARALGAEVFRAPVAEIGWRQLRSTRPDLVAAGPWFQWHFDSFSPPLGATVIAENDAGLQAFVHGRSLGVQFHPEVDLGILERWISVYPDELDRCGVDPETLLRQSRGLAAAARQVSWTLFEGYFERVAGVRSR